MTKIMVWNFKTEQFEEADKETGISLLAFIIAQSKDSAAQSQPTPVTGDVLESCGLCRKPKDDCVCHATQW